MYKLSKKIGILIITVLLFSCTSSVNQIDLSGEWDISYEDNFIYSKDLLPYSSKKIDLPGTWFNHIKNSKNISSIVWIQKRFKVNKSVSSDIYYLSLGKIAISEEIFFNGVKIGGEGYIPENNSLKYNFSWQKKRVYHIPEKLIKFNDDNLISIRIFSHIVAGIYGDLSFSVLKYSDLLFNIKSIFPEIIIASALFINFILFLFSILLLFKREKNSLIPSVILLIIDMTFIQLIFLGAFNMDGFLLFRVLMILYAMGYYLFMRIIINFVNIKNRILSYAFFLFLSLIFIFVIISSDEQFLVYVSGPIFLTGISLFSFYAFSLFCIAIYRDPLRYWFLAFGGIPIVILFSYDIYTFITLNIFKMPLSIFLYLPISFFGVMFYLIKDVRNIEKENSSLIKALLKKTQRLNYSVKLLKKDGAKPEPREKIYTVIKYLDENYSETYDRKELAKKFNMNEDYIGQIFKKTTGQNISNYINTKRIEAAKELLIETDSKIIDIGYHIGFENLTHFYRFFKRVAGMTPKEFRKTNR